MKKTLFCICLCLTGMSPAFGQGRHSVAEFAAGPQGVRDTVRAVLTGVKDPEKIRFTLADESGELTVRLGGKPKETAPAFYALDVRDGDTLTVAGVLGRKRAKGIPVMEKAEVLSIDYAANHDELPGYFFSLDEKPSFMGQGTQAFTRWVNANLVYPYGSRNDGTQGTVRLRFTIDKTGELVNVQVLQSSGDIRLDAEACRVVRSSPAWTPGSRRGKPVRVTYAFPVIFELRIPPKRDGKHPSGWD